MWILEFKMGRHDVVSAGTQCRGEQGHPGLVAFPVPVDPEPQKGKGPLFLTSECPKIL